MRKIPIRIRRHSKGARKTVKRDPFHRIIGICHTGIRDGSVHHDRDIYGIQSRDSA